MAGAKEASGVSLSRTELDELTRASVDPEPRGPVRTRHDNVDLTDDELVARIRERNAGKQPTFLLRMEYERRLRQRG